MSAPLGVHHWSLRRTSTDLTEPAFPLTQALNDDRAGETCHESLTKAVTVALRERLERVRGQQRADLVYRLKRLVLEYTSLLVVDRRSVEELIGYDDSGLPT
jgi:antitoxin VapB